MAELCVGSHHASPCFPQQLLPAIGTNWDQTPRMDTKATFNLFSPVNIKRAYVFPRPNFPSFSLPCLLMTKPKMSPHVPRQARSPRFARCHLRVWLTTALTKPNKNELGRILIFQALDEKDSFKAFKRFSPLLSSFQRSVLCSLNRRHVLKLLPSFIKLASDLQMQLPLIESCNIYLPSCDI